MNRDELGVSYHDAPPLAGGIQRRRDALLSARKLEAFSADLALAQASGAVALKAAAHQPPAQRPSYEQGLCLLSGMAAYADEDA